MRQTADCRALRLEALQEHPEALASEYAIEAAQSIADFENRLSREHTITVGAFEQGCLVGIVTLVKESLPKMQHNLMAKMIVAST